MSGQLVRVGRHDRGAAHAQLLAEARHEEDQAHPRVGDDVAQRVEAVVAAAVGDDQGALVAHDDEAGPVPRGDWSSPPSPTVATTTKGAAAMIRAWLGVMVADSLARLLAAGAVG